MKKPMKTMMTTMLARPWFAAVVLMAVGRELGAADVPATTNPVVPSLPAAAVVQANATNRFKIKGMHCTGCAKGITSEVRALKGVAAVEVSFERKQAEVAYDTNRVTQADVIRVITEAGYEATAVRGRKESRP